MTHTPGPWFWEIRERQSNVRLYTPKNGSCTVMDFTRLGMQKAQPRFSNRNGLPLGGIMIEATKLDLDHHPDACLITAAPDLLESCKELLAWFEGAGLTYDEDGEECQEVINARRAINKAEPKLEQPQ